MRASRRCSAASSGSLAAPEQAQVVAGPGDAVGVAQLLVQRPGAIVVGGRSRGIPAGPGEVAPERAAHRRVTPVPDPLDAVEARPRPGRVRRGRRTARRRAAARWPARDLAAGPDHPRPSRAPAGRSSGPRRGGLGCSRTSRGRRRARVPGRPGRWPPRTRRPRAGWPGRRRRRPPTRSRHPCPSAPRSAPRPSRSTGSAGCGSRPPRRASASSSAAYSRRLSSIVNSVVPRRSRRRTRLFSTSEAMLSTTSGTSPTCCAASSDHPPTNTDNRRNSARSSGPSRSWLHASAARKVRCRSGPSRAPLVSSRIRCRRRNVSSPGVNRFRRAAASSRASGSPSSRMQISAIDAALAVVRAKSGWNAAHPVQQHRDRRRRREAFQVGEVVRCAAASAATPGTPARPARAAAPGWSRAAAGAGTRRGELRVRGQPRSRVRRCPRPAAGVGPPPPPRRDRRAVGRLNRRARERA